MTRNINKNIARFDEPNHLTSFVTDELVLTGRFTVSLLVCESGVRKLERLLLTSQTGLET